MNIIINTSTFSDSHIDNSPKFINNLILNFDVKNNYFVLYPHKTTKPDKKLFPNNITLIPYRYILPNSLSNLSEIGLLPSLKQNKLNIIKIILLIISQFFHLLYLVAKIKPQIIYSHWVFPQAFISSILGKIFNVKTVFTSHGSDLKILSKIGTIGKIILNFTLKNSTKFTVVSNLCLNYFSSENLKKYQNKLDVIPMGISEQFFTANDSKLDSKEYTNILFYGRMIDYKGIDLLINSIYKLVNENDFKIRCKLIGDGVEKPKYEKLVKSLTLEDHITFESFLTQSKLIEEIDLADLVVIPSKLTDIEFEAGPLSLIESMSRKKICVVSNSVGFASLVNEKNSVLFKSNDQDNLYKKIIYVLNLDTDKKKEIENNAYEYSKNFKFTKISKKTEDFLFNL